MENELATLIRAATGDHIGQALTAVRDLRLTLAELEAAAVRAAVGDEWSARAIGDAIGVSRQAAHKLVQRTLLGGTPRRPRAAGTQERDQIWNWDRDALERERIVLEILAARERVEKATMGIDLDTGTDRMLARVEDGIGWMTYNNPARLNAMSMDMNRAVPVILSAFQERDDVRVVVVTGAGGRAFVSGADISEFGDKRTSVDARAEYDRVAAEAGRAWGLVDKPIIAMIRGYCIGGGLATALQADIRIAAEGSQFGVPAAKLGLGYGFAGIEKLMQLVGPAWAAEIFFSARRLADHEALRIGLVNRIVPDDRLEHDVAELAGTMAANAPLTVKACKAAIREALKEPAKRNLDNVAAMVEACFRSEDYKEGQQAFMEKRPPRFQGR